MAIQGFRTKREYSPFSGYMCCKIISPDSISSTKQRLANNICDRIFLGADNARTYNWEGTSLNVKEKRESKILLNLQFVEVEMYNPILDRRLLIVKPIE